VLSHVGGWRLDWLAGLRGFELPNGDWASSLRKVGAKPAELSEMQSIKFDFVINPQPKRSA
jgi:hypothetical protein